MNLINVIAAVIGAGVLERYPNLQLDFGESGISSLPYASTAWILNARTRSGI